MNESQTISAEKLCEFTGLTDRRHRQLAKSGYFPPPLNGEYQLAPTIRGLFKHFREMLDKKDNTVEQERQKYLRARREKTEIERDILQRKYYPRAEVVRALRSAGAALKSTLSGKARNEIPQKLLGLTVPEMLPVMEQITHVALYGWHLSLH